MKTSRRRRATVGFAVALLLAGAGSIALAATASAAPTFSVAPDTDLSSGQVVVVSGSGLSDSAIGAIVECNNDPDQPTIAVLGNQIPVSCTNPLHAEASVSASGVLAATNFTVAEGQVGPPTTGTDSSSGSATTDPARIPARPAHSGDKRGCLHDFLWRYGR